MTKPAIFLDHASLHVSDFTAAVSYFEKVLGLKITVTPHAKNHGRIFLNKSYIEVSKPPSSKNERWGIQWFFLRFANQKQLMASLKAKNVAVASASPYIGHDGTWQNVVLKQSTAKFPVPILIKRLTPKVIARSWPPSLKTPHTSSAIALHSVIVQTPVPKQASEFYARLQSKQYIHTLKSSGKNPAIAGFILRTKSLSKTRQYFKKKKTKTTFKESKKILMIDPAKTFGIQIGFTE